MALAETSDTAAAERASGSSFYNAMRVLPRAQREAMFEIYSFCRQVDDIADSSGPVSQIFTVNFGQLPGGGRTATVVGESPTSDQAVVDAIVNSKPQGNGQTTREKART